MARPAKELPSRSAIVPAAARLAQAAGVDMAALALRFALPEDVARLEDVTTAAGVADELIHAVARAGAGRDAEVALRLAMQLEGRRHTLVGLAVRASPRVREALVRLARWTPLLHEGLEAAVEDAGDEARWVLRTPRRPRGVGRYVHELALASALHQARAGGARDVPVTRAWFVHARPPDLGALATFFGTTSLAFGCEDSGFAVARVVLEAPMPGAEPSTVSAIEPLVDAELQARTLAAGASLADRVAVHVAASLPDAADVTALAAALHMSPRTLQRRLEAEGTRFTEVVDAARLGEAKRLLLDALSLTEIAYRLGFADLAAFSRAFKRWTGQPPGQWRRS
jgi:AraC-like DNA-binding protein